MPRRRSANLVAIDINVKKLLIVQPYLAKYRVPVFRTLAGYYDLTVAASLADAQSGFGSFDSDESFVFQELQFKRWFGLEWQAGIVKALRRGPDAVLIAANPRHLSYWFVLFYCLVFRIPVFCHGQGPYGKKRLSLVRRSLYRLEFALCKRYICYTPYSRESFVRFGLGSDKLRVAENSLHLDCVDPSALSRPEGLHVLFIGRLRPGSGLELLIDAMSRFVGRTISLHVVGDGEQRGFIENAAARHQWIHWHGSVYDDEELKVIAGDCTVGCYPGDAGLSILHYMALGLPTMAHDNMAAHMGPEPTYIEDGVNGFLFDSENKTESMAAIFEGMFDGRYDLNSIAVNAVAAFKNLTNPSLGERMRGILQEAGI